MEKVQYVEGIRTLAGAIGVSYGVMQAASARNDWPVKTDKGYDVEQIARYLLTIKPRSDAKAKILTYLGEDPAEGDEDDDVGNSPALERLRLAKAKQAEIQLKAMQGEYVKKEEIAEAVLAAFTDTSNIIRTLHKKLSFRLQNLEASEVSPIMIEEENNILNALKIVLENFMAKDE